MAGCPALEQLPGADTTYSSFLAAVPRDAHTPTPQRLRLLYRVYKDMSSKASWSNVLLRKLTLTPLIGGDGEMFEYVLEGVFRKERKKRPRSAAAGDEGGGVEGDGREGVIFDGGFHAKKARHAGDVDDGGIKVISSSLAGKVMGVERVDSGDVEGVLPIPPAVDDYNGGGGGGIRVISSSEDCACGDSSAKDGGGMSVVVNDGGGGGGDGCEAMKSGIAVVNAHEPAAAVNGGSGAASPDAGDGLAEDGDAAAAAIMSVNGNNGGTEDGRERPKAATRPRAAPYVAVVYPMAYDEEINAVRLLELAGAAARGTCADDAVPVRPLMLALCNEAEIVYQDVRLGLAEPAPEKEGKLRKPMSVRRRDRKDKKGPANSTDDAVGPLGEGES